MLCPFCIPSLVPGIRVALDLGPSLDFLGLPWTLDHVTLGLGTRQGLESFRLEEENEFNLKFLHVFSKKKKRQPGKLHFTFFFTKKLSTVIHTERG